MTGEDRSHDSPEEDSPDDNPDGDSQRTDLERAVETFFDDVDETFAEYDQGYADADATLRIVRTQLDALRENVEE